MTSPYTYVQSLSAHKGDPDDLRRTRLPGGNETLELWEGEQRRVQSPYLLTRRWSVRGHGLIRALYVDVAEANSSSNSNVDWEFSL